MNEVAEAIDTLENLIAALGMPIPDRIHVDAMRGQLPQVVDQIRRGYLSAGGEDVWGS
jgi:hypothetical protein